MDLKPGTTPIAFLSNFIAAKMENKNPSGSIKDRITESVLTKLRNDGIISIGSSLISILNGEYAVSFAYFCAKKGYKCNIVCPKHINKNHLSLCKMFGANIYLIDSNQFEYLKKERDEIILNTPGLLNVDFYDDKMVKDFYKISFCQELQLQLQASHKNLKNIFIYSESGIFAEALKESFPNSDLYNVSITNGWFNLNGKKREIVNNLNVFSPKKKIKGLFKGEEEVNFDKVLNNIKDIASKSGLLMDYRTSACYLVAKDYICFNNDVNLIIFYENGERYVEEVFCF